MSFSCTLVNTTLNMGDSVLVRVDAAGNLGFESDFKQASFQASSDGSTPIDVGPLNGGGFFSLRVVNGPDSVLLGIIAVPTASGATSFELDASQAARPSGVDQSGPLTKFIQNLTLDRVKAASAARFQAWALHNAASLGTDVVVCGAALSGLAVFGLSCVESSIDSLNSLAIDILSQAAVDMAADQTLSDDEANNVKDTLQGILIGVNISLAESNVSKILEVFSGLNQVAISNDQANMTIQLGIDEAKKATLLLSILKH